MEEQPAIREVSVWEKPKNGQLGVIVRCSVKHAKLRFIGDPVKFVRHLKPVNCICPNTKEKPDACPLHPVANGIGRWLAPMRPGDGPALLGDLGDAGETRYAAWVFDRNDRDDPSTIKIAEFDVHIFDKVHEWFKSTGRNPGQLNAPCFQIVVASEVSVRLHYGPRQPSGALRYTVIEEDHRVTMTVIEEDMSPKEFASIGKRDLRVELVEKFKETKPSVIEAMVMDSRRKA